MKLSVITDEISTDLVHALDVMREYGARGAELRGVWGKNIADLSDDEVAKARALLHDKGMTVSCVASPLYKCDLTRAESAATGPTHLAKERTLADQPAMLDRCAKLADVFQTRLVRIFAFWKRGDLTPQIEDRIVEELSAGAEAAGRKGITLVLENEHACYIGTGEETARVLARVNSPHLRAVWDPGNAFCAGEVPFPVGYEAIKSHIGHVHLKDAVRLENDQCKFVTIGEGEIDYAGQFKALKDTGYDGWLSLETHFAPPGGDGEAGSRLCLAALARML